MVLPSLGLHCHARPHFLQVAHTSSIASEAGRGVRLCRTFSSAPTRRLRNSPSSREMSDGFARTFLGFGSSRQIESGRDL
jgi:hypothetical protein